MDKEICFFIDNNTLFLDKVLVSFNDTPIFFVCCDSSRNYYIVLCTNVEDLEYVIVKCSLHSLYEMLSKKVEMRALFTNASYFWSVKAGSTWESDEVQYLNSTHMNTDNLPYPNAYYEARNAEEIEYVEKIAAAYYASDNFSTIESQTDIEEAVATFVEISFDFARECDSYIDCTPAAIDSFTQKAIVFEVSNMSDSSLAYLENKVWGSHSSIGTDKIKKAPTNEDCLAA